MAGTRLATQLAFLVSVLLLVPLGLLAVLRGGGGGGEGAAIVPPPAPPPSSSRREAVARRLAPLLERSGAAAATLRVVAPPSLVPMANEAVAAAGVEGVRIVVAAATAGSTLPPLVLGEYALVLLEQQPVAAVSGGKAGIDWRWEERRGRAAISTDDASAPVITSLITEATAALGAALASATADAAGARMAVPPPARELQLTLLTEDPTAEGVCRWDFGGSVLTHLARALEQLSPIVHLKASAQLAAHAPVLPPGLLHAPGHHQQQHQHQHQHQRRVPRSALGTLGAHLEESVLPPPVVVAGGEYEGEVPPLRPLQLVVLCPSSASSSASLVFVGDDGAAPATALELEGWGGVLALAPADVISNTTSSSSVERGPRRRGQQQRLLSRAGHRKVAAFASAFLRRWLGFEGRPTSSSSSSSSSSLLLPLTGPEVDALAVVTLRARVREALGRLRALQEEMLPRRRRWWAGGVPGRVARLMDHALASLEALADGASKDLYLPWARQLELATAALTATLAAQHDEGLLPPPHFPWEHHAAVLLPLLLPVLLPLAVGTAKEWRRHAEKTQRRKVA